MAKLPTAVLRHRHSGERRIVDLPVYGCDIARWRDWALVTTRRGAASADIVERALAEHAANADRLAHSGDRRRAFEARRLSPRAEADDWRRLPWFSARALVKRRTGTLPRDKAHAEALMDDPSPEGSGPQGDAS